MTALSNVSPGEASGALLLFLRFIALVSGRGWSLPRPSASGEKKSERQCSRSLLPIGGGLGPTAENRGTGGRRGESPGGGAVCTVCVLKSPLVGATMRSPCLRRGLQPLARAFRPCGERELRQTSADGHIRRSAHSPQRGRWAWQRRRP